MIYSFQSLDHKGVMQNHTNAMKGSASNAVQKVQVGEVIEGTLIKNGDGQVQLRINDELSLPVQIQGEVSLGKALQFEVIAKQDGQLILQAQEGGDESPISLVQKTLDMLNLPESNAMKELIRCFLDKQLPLNKEQLVKNYYRHQSFELPIESLVNLLEQDIPLTLDELKSIMNYKQDMLQDLNGKLLELIARQEEPTVLEELMTTIAEHMDQQLVGRINGSLIKELLTVSSGLQNTEEIIQKEDTMIDSLINQNELGKSSKGLVDTDIIKIKQSLADILDQDNIDTQTFKSLISTLLNGKEEQVEFLRQAAACFVKKGLSLNIEDLRACESDFKQVKHMTKVLKGILDFGETLDDETFKSILEGQGQKVIQVLEKMNVEAQYYTFPFIIEDKQKQGELYFFKPKKKNREQKDYLYIVLALDLPAIKKLEVHIQNEGKSINLGIRVTDEKIKSFLEVYEKKLIDFISQTGYQLTGLTIGLISDEVNMNTPREEAITLSHLDFKV